jgi:CheY-like chemotaxis protein
VACPGRSTILLVEDEILTRLAASEELRAHGYAVIEAASADEALTVLNGPTRVDLVITDMKMPGALDGIGLAQHIRGTFPFMKVVMVSGQVAGPEVHALVDGYLHKPIDPSQLASFVHTLTQANIASASRE